MAYIDYGGRAWRNGIRRAERSDHAMRAPCDDPNDGGIGHAGLGDEHVQVLLYKGYSVEVFVHGRLQARIHRSKRFVNGNWNGCQRIPFEIEGHRIEMAYERTAYSDAMYAELIQPDGTRWTGWSRYWAGNRAGEDDIHAERNATAADGRLRRLMRPSRHRRPGGPRNCIKQRELTAGTDRPAETGAHRSTSTNASEARA